MQSYKMVSNALQDISLYTVPQCMDAVLALHLQFIFDPKNFLTF